MLSLCVYCDLYYSLSIMNCLYCFDMLTTRFTELHVDQTEDANWQQRFFKNGPSPAPFCLYSLFSNTNFTENNCRL